MSKSNDLETINTAEEIILQRVLRGLSAAPFKMTQDEILTSNAVYESAHGMLSKGMNEVSARVLVFLRWSLRAVASRPLRDHTARARDLLRCSGCLQDMLAMFFITKTKSKKIWKVLCECLAESCRDCPDNQRYCSSLIPICIQRRDEMNNEILKLLYCLLVNNTSNINLFVECNGTSIFTKGIINDSSRVKLLSVVVENASAANILKWDHELLKSLITVGEDNEMAEWVSVILFHLASHIQGIGNATGTTINRSGFDRETNINETTSNNLSVSFLFNWEEFESSKVLKNATIQNKINDLDSKCFTAEHMDLRSSTIEFVPKFVSTPKKSIATIRGVQVADCSKELINRTEQKSIATIRGVQVADCSKELINRTEQKSDDVTQRKPCGNNAASLIKKMLTTSARLLSIVKSSCVSSYHATATTFCQKLADTKSRSLLKQKFKNDKGTMNKYTTYFKQRADTKRKIQKSIVKKLKTGMHFYGCNFKKIALVMWANEKEMTPKVLYKVYRKYILK